MGFGRDAYFVGFYNMQELFSQWLINLLTYYEQIGLTWKSSISELYYYTINKGTRLKTQFECFKGGKTKDPYNKMY